ncbi:MAG: formylmethanofuran dehydrogenase subunit E family protein [Candidatus Altiarchaeota archaeon]
MGPYLVLGLKAGMLARERLEQSPFKLNAKVTLKLEKPVSCFIDGLQVASGCTMGKRNITAVEGGGIKVEFKSEKSSMTLKVKDDILEWIQSLSVTRKNEEQISREVFMKAYEELFEF